MKGTSEVMNKNFNFIKMGTLLESTEVKHSDVDFFRKETHAVCAGDHALTLFLLKTFSQFV